MKSLLREQLERPVHRPVEPLVTSGSPAVLDLDVPPGIRVPLRIEAIKALHQCGLPLIDAKRAIETMLVACHVRVSLPSVGDVAALQAYLAERDIAATHVKTA